MSAQFNVLTTRDQRKRFSDLPRSIPWTMVEAHREQARRNHYQSLETLHRRGGLGIRELYAVLQDRPYEHISESLALEFLLDLLETYATSEELAA